MVAAALPVGLAPVWAVQAMELAQVVLLLGRAFLILENGDQPELLHLFKQTKVYFQFKYLSANVFQIPPHQPRLLSEDLH